MYTGSGTASTWITGVWQAPILVALSRAGLACRQDQSHEGPADGATLSEISWAMEAGEALSRRGSAAKPARRLPLLPSLSIPGVLALRRVCWLLAAGSAQGPVRVWVLRP